MEHNLGLLLVGASVTSSNRYTTPSQVGVAES